MSFGTSSEKVCFRARRGFTLVELLVVIAIIGVLVALLLPAIQAARESARRMTCTNHLKQMGLANLNYESSNKKLPPGSTAGTSNKNGFSWHVEILPFAEFSSLNNQIQQQIEAKTVTRTTRAGTIEDLPEPYQLEDVDEIKIDVYRCPSDSLRYDDLARITWGRYLESTNYYGVAGSAYSRSVQNPQLGGIDPLDFRTGSLEGSTNFDGPLFYDSEVKFSEITDGTSNTFMIGERWYQVRSWLIGGREASSGNPSNNVAPSHLMYSVKNIDSRYLPNSEFGPGYYVLHDNYSEEKIPPGGQAVVGLNDLYWGSFHSGGVNFAYVDGSVHFISDDIDPLTWLAMGSRNGGEVVGQP
ncbi:DUF1559 domain-containing protein [Bythopirellula goksoeyrii]|uniref:Putative major pilin subunit n=1 Tax=Bythopirellula goksoeyrii TaxID=1400387 RepID=A0A5B9QF19_9BACT|nr:DUF1559 domain-containing protein [Bythopirellula goksoeyrii]QEG37544.1 putative major pilin subunit [Bythopirellula goksoeyrii]